MELYFTDPDTDAKASIQTKARLSGFPSLSGRLQTRNQSVEDFISAMGKAEPKPSASKTNMTVSLMELFNGYMKERMSSAKERPKTIIILTDGIWAGMNDDGELDKLIRHQLGLLAGYHTTNLKETRPVTIQFVAFGSDPAGLRRMKRLDDEIRP